MIVLHISNGYADSRVHSNLTKELDAIGISQIVYCPVRNKRDLGANRHEANDVDFVYSYAIRPWHKYIYHLKVWRLYADLKKKVDLSKVDLIHASTTFSDGALAYRAFKEYNIPYLVAVRNTDFGVFIKHKLYHTWPLGKQILLNARKVYFISKSGQERFLATTFTKPILESIRDKMILRPNGIEKIWLDNISTKRNLAKKICFIGTFLPRKNLVRVIDAIHLLRQENGYEDVTLMVVGGGKDSNGQSNRAIKAYSEFVEYKGRISDKHTIIRLMRECCMFVMPSVNETFGLVYVEALSQNLPIVYTKCDGVDGLFDDSVGMAVNPCSTEEIKQAVKLILDHPERFGNRGVDFLDYNWRSIAEKYLEDYNQILK